jgi:ribosomal protein S18 acetylase RimI-like enzyme
MTLELADEVDVPRIMEMMTACITRMRSFGIDQWDEVYPTADVFRDDIRGKNLFLVRGAGETVVGCATLDDRQSPEYAAVKWLWSEGLVGVVHRLMVAPSHGGRGIATSIMNGLELEATRRGYKTIRLDAFCENSAAMRLYTGLGYREAGTIRGRKGVFACFERQLGGTE